MPTLSRWLIKSSLVYLILGVGVGGVLLAEKAIRFNAVLWQLLPLHIEWLLLGWMLQFAVGVACWILPGKVSVRGRRCLGWFGYGGLNGGLALALCLHLGWVDGGSHLVGWFRIGVGAVTLGGILGLILSLRPRIGFIMADEAMLRDRA